VSGSENLRGTLISRPLYFATGVLASKDEIKNNRIGKGPADLVATSLVLKGAKLNGTPYTSFPVGGGVQGFGTSQIDILVHNSSRRSQ